MLAENSALPSRGRGRKSGQTYNAMEEVGAGTFARWWLLPEKVVRHLLNSWWQVACSFENRVYVLKDETCVVGQLVRIMEVDHWVQSLSNSESPSWWNRASQQPEAFD